MVYEFYSEEIENFAFLEVGHTPDVTYRVNHRVFAVGGDDFYGEHIPVTHCGGKIVNHTEIFLPIHTYNGGKEVKFEPFGISEGLSQRMPNHIGDSHFEDVSVGELSFRADFSDYIFNIAHFSC